MQIAQTILQQLGGNKFVKMTGAKHLVALKDGLAFKLPSTRHFVKEGINYVKIILNPLDLYDIEYGTIKGFDYNIKATANGLYCDMLQENFTRTTGLYTSL